jgi:NADH:ubiquinone oxidoreductase subunit 6 (subunit J)
VWFAFLCDAVAIICAVAFLATANGRWAPLFIGVTFLAIAALSALTAPFLSPRLAAQIAVRVMGLALLCAFAVFALVPVSMWCGQIWAHDLIQAMPTLGQHTPSMLP